MGLDIRWPIGLMFTIIGALLTVTGLLTSSKPESYQRSLGLNVDLWWGLVLLAFGLFMLFMAKRGSNRAGGGAQASGEKPGVTINTRSK
jgi:hypothetical protein